jgi:predicted Rossmann fold flavoprotein
VGTLRVVVVGGGPSGMMAAIRAAQLHQDVILFEKNASLGKKLLLSGKGRCNLTNACDLESFLERFSHRGQFLRDAFKKFFNQELIEFFSTRGLELKTERQMRVFPVTDRSNSILDVLKKELQDRGVKVICNADVTDISVSDGRVREALLSDKRSFPADRVILATGGISFSLTGSTGEGLKIAERLGHRITPLRPGLVPIKTKERFVKELEGLTLENIRISFIEGKRKIVTEIGELLFTSFGISGPLVLTHSGLIADWLIENKDVFVEVDLKPALSREQLDSRLLREFHGNSRKSIRNVFKGLLPQRLIDCFLKIAKIDPEKQASQVTREERNSIVGLLKGFRMQIIATLPIEEGMVTRGGVSLKDVDPRTMESRKVGGLYFCGEMIDIDADTGGFNLQAAFSTGYLAGESAALSAVGSS